MRPRCELGPVWLASLSSRTIPPPRPCLSWRLQQVLSCRHDRVRNAVGTLPGRFRHASRGCWGRWASSCHARFTALSRSLLILVGCPDRARGVRNAFLGAEKRDGPQISAPHVHPCHARTSSAEIAGQVRPHFVTLGLPAPPLIGSVHLYLWLHLMLESSRSLLVCGRLS